MKAIHPQLQVHLLKRDCILTIGWERAIRVEVKDDKTCSLMWIAAVVEKHQLQEAEHPRQV